MRTYMHTILISIPFCIICLVCSIMLEFGFVCIKSNSFYANIFLGLFASGILIIMTSVISFYNEKKQYYMNVFLNLSKSISVIKLFIEELNVKNKDIKYNTFVEEIKSNLDLIKFAMWEYTSFFHRNHKDIIIDSVVVIIVKFLLVQNELIRLSNQLRREEINMETYTQCFDKITNELVYTYLPKFVKCEEEVQSIINKLVKDRTLKNIFEEDNSDTFIKGDDSH